MLLLSPAKLLVVLVIALVVLGPDKLPKVAKQVGRLWGDFSKFRDKLESEVRSALPDLPSADAITQAVRSPLAYLDSLATDEDEKGETPSDGPGGAGPGAEDGFVPMTGAQARSSDTRSATDDPMATEDPTDVREPGSDPLDVANHVRPILVPGADHSELN